MVNRIIFVVSGPYTIDLDYTKTFVTSDVNHCVIPYERRDGRLTPHPRVEAWDLDDWDIAINIINDILQ